MKSGRPPAQAKNCSLTNSVFLLLILKDGFPKIEARSTSSTERGYSEGSSGGSTTLASILARGYSGGYSTTRGGYSTSGYGNGYGNGNGYNNGNGKRNGAAEVASATLLSTLAFGLLMRVIC